MGQHRRHRPRRSLLARAAVVTTALSVLTAAAVLAGSHGATSEATAARPPAPAFATAAPAAPELPAATGAASPAPVTADAAGPSPAATDPPAPTDATAAPSPVGDSPAGDSPAATAPGTTAVAPATAEAATVGALFTGGVRPGNHFCTASVLHSSTGNLLLTAAHCLDDPAGVTFAPGYRDGRAPYGTWRVTAVHTTTGWSRDGDPDEDFAVLETAADASGHRVEEVVGANPLGTDEDFGTTVRLYGYPSGSEEPLLCTSVTGRHSAYQRVVDCPDYPGGTSGGPWISTTTGRVVGTIGGYQEGGDTPDTSYSAYFDHTVAALYAEALAAAGS
ncbi:trypsin-like peptidase domain-containing protein [Streptomyces sp. BE20]|uniref:trypsin-like serine peptidase n=1 Tax=Streptomyces sp. BE20 TaxID=3002525 RepID=UPI002E7A3193|nr:trypsin-like peptidase domain-containing protein [Streptomyces sp. BE20]MEE1826868.1 trypsin-like peptidase domain-containing protein [Streptomyces sp. BE20]